MAADLSYQSDPRWGSFSEEEQKNYNKERFNKDYDQFFTPEQEAAYKSAANISYEAKAKLAKTNREQQEALNTQAQEYRQQDQARDYQQANQAYRY
jgi:hypothetical protein